MSEKTWNHMLEFSLIVLLVVAIVIGSELRQLRLDKAQLEAELGVKTDALNEANLRIEQLKE